MSRDIKRNPFEVEMFFDNSESKEIRKLAEIRQDFKSKHSSMVRDKRIINRDDTETHQIGITGEYAFQKLTYYNLDSGLYLAGNKEEDFKIHGVRIEVKTLQGYLTFKKLSDFKAQIAVLVIYDLDDYSHVWVQGWIPKNEFIANHFIDNFGYGDRPCIQPAALYPISTLKTYCLTLSKILKMYKEIRSIKEKR